MKVGIISSSGGSAFLSAFDILLSCEILSENDFIVITDRPCDCESGCEARGIQVERIESDDVQYFSQRASEKLLEMKCDIVLLFFTRIVTGDLYTKLPTLNIHPSLLPSFVGFGAVRNAVNAGVKFLGATLHMVNKDLDAGQIMGQVITPVSPYYTESELNKISYIQKIFLTLCLIDLVNEGYMSFDPSTQSLAWLRQPEATCSTNPCLVSEGLKKAFIRLQNSAGIKALSL